MNTPARELVVQYFWRIISILMAVSAPIAAAEPTPGDDYAVLWAVENAPSASGRAAGQWSESISFGGATIRRDMWVFHEADVGFPVAGPHAFEGDAAAEQRLRSAIRRAVSSRIVDPAATGYGVLDVESWRPSWTLCPNVPSSAGALAADRDFKDDWRQFVQDRRPKLLSGIPQDQFEAAYAQSFDAAARKIFVLCIEECRRTRPGVRWGFYMYPPRVIPGPDGSMPASSEVSQEEANLGWLYDAEDALFPDVCQLRFTVEDAQPDRALTENSADENRTYIDRNVAEAVKAAGGKPVVAIVWPRYPRTNKQYGDRFLNSVNLRQLLARRPARRGRGDLGCADLPGTVRRTSGLRDAESCSRGAVAEGLGRGNLSADRGVRREFGGEAVLDRPNGRGPAQGPWRRLGSQRKAGRSAIDQDHRTRQGTTGVERPEAALGVLAGRIGHRRPSALARSGERRHRRQD